jgi:DNA-directed RNA polymerase subunit RPC12/RpoP
MYHKPVCVKCNREMRPEKNGVGCLDLADFGPYKIWDSDLWKCPGCGYEILVGFGQKAVAEHFQAHFEQVITGYRQAGALVESRG